MNNNDVEIKAGEWLARIDRDALSPEELAAFERWRGEDPRHGAAYERLAATWQALDRIQAIRPSTAESVDHDYLSGTLQQSRYRDIGGLAAQYPHLGPTACVAEGPIDQSNIRSRRHSSQRWIFFSIAATILIAVGGLWIAHLAGGSQTFRTGIGGFQRIVLDDQSTVELDTNSEVRVAITARLRKVDLVRGEANFEVAHDSSRPFIVSAGKMAVRAVGTKFDVRRSSDSVEVTVGEGKVVLGAPALLEAALTVIPPTMLPLVAGQTALSSGDGVHLQTLSKEGVARKLAWQNQILVFDGDPLTNVVAQFNRYNQRQLVIADPRIAGLQIGGYFRPTNLDAFVSVLQSDFGLRVAFEGNRLVIAAASAK
jgi:transmembrane sensor